MHSSVIVQIYSIVILRLRYCTLAMLCIAIVTLIEYISRMYFHQIELSIFIITVGNHRMNIDGFFFNVCIVPLYTHTNKLSHGRSVAITIRYASSASSSGVIYSLLFIVHTCSEWNSLVYAERSISLDWS